MYVYLTPELKCHQNPLKSDLVAFVFDSLSVQSMVGKTEKRFPK